MLFLGRQEGEDPGEEQESLELESAGRRARRRKERPSSPRRHWDGSFPRKGPKQSTEKREEQLQQEEEKDRRELEKTEMIHREEKIRGIKQAVKRCKVQVNTCRERAELWIGQSIEKLPEQECREGEEDVEEELRKGKVPDKKVDQDRKAKSNRKQYRKDQFETLLEEEEEEPEERKDGIEEGEGEEEEQEESRKAGRLGVKDLPMLALIGSAWLLILGGWIAYAYNYISADLI